MAKTSYELRELPWDSSLFGIKMGEVIIDCKNSRYEYKSDIWQNTIEIARQQSYRFLLCQLDARYKEIAVELVNQGAEIGDLLVTLELNLLETKEVQGTASKKTPASSKIRVTTAHLNDLAAICRIASENFTYSRIYQDSRFGQAKAREFYSKWILDSFGTSESLYVLRDAPPKTNVMGFISLQFHELMRRIVIRLIAVDMCHRGNGYGQALIDWLIREAVTQDFNRIQVGTQAGNIPAMNLYKNNGFQAINSRYRFHVWLDSNPSSPTENRWSREGLGNPLNAASISSERK